MLVIALWCCMWGRGRRGNNGTCSALCWISVTSPTADNEVGLFWCWFPGGWACVRSRTLWVCEAGSFSHCRLNPHRCFQTEVLRLYFPTLKLRVAWSILLPRCSSQFICRWMWDCPVRNLLPPWVLKPLPCLQSSLHRAAHLHPSCLPVWMTVSSLTPWLSNFHTVSIFCQFWLFFIFKFVVVVLLVVRGGTVCLPTPPSWPEVPNQYFLNNHWLISSGFFLSLSRLCPCFGCTRRWSTPTYAFILAGTPTTNIFCLF